jgi:protein LTV1
MRQSQINFVRMPDVVRRFCSPCSTASSVTVTRPKNEPKEEKKVRKQVVKAERQARRIEKKATKEQFSAEFERQKKVANSKGQGNTRKL